MIQKTLAFFTSSQIRSSLTAIAIILAASALAIASGWHDALVVDEVPHVGAGYAYLTKQDMRLNPEHPPLVKSIGALPLLFLNIDQSAFTNNAWTNDINGQWEFGRHLIYRSGNNAQLITRLVKFPIILFFFIPLALVIFFWTRARYGAEAGLLATLLFSFSPTVVAHSKLVTTDIPATLGVVIATFAYLYWLRNTTKKNFFLAAMAFGLALTMKFSSVLLIPFFVVLAILWNYRLIGKTILMMIVGFVLIVWPVYAWHIKNYPIDRQRHDTENLITTFKDHPLGKLTLWASGKPILRQPAHYALGFLMVVQRVDGGNQVYFRGTVADSAGPGYFPFVYLIKEPLPWLILLMIAALATLIKIKKINIREHFEEIAMLLWIAIYLTISIQNSLNIGIRHLLPIYPFMAILVSRQIVRIKPAWILVGWFVAESLLTFPNYLSYFNQTVGGSQGGYRYVVDSNLDWGQDLKRLADWAKENDIESIELDYFGWADPNYYLSNRFKWLADGKPQGLWIAVSGTYLMNNSDGKYAWLVNKIPFTVIGNSIFVYHL